jgi:hypothetical protein
LQGIVENPANPKRALNSKAPVGQGFCFVSPKELAGKINFKNRESFVRKQGGFGRGPDFDTQLSRASGWSVSRSGSHLREVIVPRDDTQARLAAILAFELQEMAFHDDVSQLASSKFQREVTYWFRKTEEEVDAQTGVPVCQVGELWQLGDHRIHCGDATTETAFNILMNEGRADVVFVDPPFNVPVKGHVSGKGKVRHREFAQGTGEFSRDEFIQFLNKTCGLLAKHSRDGAIHYVCMDWRHADELLAAGREIYPELKNIVVWVKSSPGMGSLYRSQHELIFVYKSGTGRHTNNIELGKHGRNRTNVWNYDSASVHP